MKRTALLKRRKIGLRNALAKKAPFSKRYRMPKLASHSRVAFSSTASKTGFNSPGDLLMTPRTSEVAVCCCKDSDKSSVRWRRV